MKRYVFVATLCTLALSCEKKTDSTVQDVNRDSLTINESDIEVEAIPHSCWLEAKGNDSLFAMIDDNLGTVTGKLKYQNYQKDSSSGDINGISSGDTLKVDYIFQSEGVTSTREIWFLKKNGNLIEGIGDYDESGERYKDPKNIKFEGGHSLAPAECAGFEKNFAKLEGPAAISEPAKPEDGKHQLTKQK